MITRLRTWLARQLNPQCEFCGLPRLLTQPLCAGCYEDLPWLAVQYNQPTLYCQQTISAFAYQSPISNLLLAIKFGRDLGKLSTLSTLTAEAILQQIDRVPEAILPIPLHRQRLRKRGFNQALELARPLAQRLHIPLLTDSVIRQKATHAQTELNFEQRQQNLQQAFQLNKPLPYQHIIIFDDVITTGATTASLASLLRQHGVKRVDSWSCARAISHAPHPVNSSGVLQKQIKLKT